MKTNNHWKAKNGVIATCIFCGEQVGNTQKYCPEHKTQKGRKATFDLNVEIIKKNKAKGMSVPETLKDWR